MKKQLEPMEFTLEQKCAGRS
uniref:Methylenetetrahydrofolate reductase 2-like n=1 Tax=Rhizophora mucronata TaxID=61149 RepID=A0A2P2JJ42_RHIMU